MHADSSYCRLYFEGYHGLQADLTREFVIDRQGVVTVTDSFNVHRGVLQAGPIFHGERVRRLGPHTYRLRLENLKMNDGNEIANLPGELEVEFAFGEGQVLIRKGFNTPAILDTLPAYQRFPCTGYKKFWKGAYSARRCLTFSRILSARQEGRFVTVLRPITA